MEPDLSGIELLEMIEKCCHLTDDDEPQENKLEAEDQKLQNWLDDKATRRK